MIQKLFLRLFLIIYDQILSNISCFLDYMFVFCCVHATLLRKIDKILPMTFGSSSPIGRLYFRDVEAEHN